MLTKLNDRLKGVVAWAIVVLIAITFTLFGLDSYLQSRNISDSAIEVDGVKISKHEYELHYRRARQQIDPAMLDQAKDTALKSRVVEELVNKQVALTAAEKNGFQVDAPQAQAAILGIPQFQEDGRFSPDRYQQALSAAMFTPETFLKEVEQGMTLNQQRYAFIGTSFALPQEINRFIQLYFQKRDYQYFLIPYKNLAKSQMVSDTAVREYYSAHQTQFLTPEKVSVKYIALSLAQEREQQSKNITEQQIRAYYDENKQNFIQPAKWQIARILIAANQDNIEKQKAKAEKLALQVKKSPKSFETIQKQNTDDKLALSNQANLPWVNAGQGELSKVLMHLTKAGDVSGVVKTKYGFEIYQVKQYTPASVRPFSSVKSMIQQQLVNSRAEKSFNQKLETLTDLTFQTPDSLEPAAKETGLPIRETELFSRDGGNEEPLKQSKFVQAAFSHDVLDLSNNSEQISLDGDRVVFMRVKDHIAASEKPLDEVKNEIKQIIRMQNATKLATKLGDSFIQGKIQESALAKDIGLDKITWKHAKNATRDNSDAPAEINQFAYMLQQPNELRGETLINKGYLVVKLKAIYPGDLHSVNVEQRQALKQQLESSLGMMSYDLYLNGLLAKANVANHTGN